MRGAAAEDALHHKQDCPWQATALLSRQGCAGTHRCLKLQEGWAKCLPTLQFSKTTSARDKRCLKQSGPHLWACVHLLSPLCRDPSRYTLRYTDIFKKQKSNPYLVSSLLNILAICGVARVTG